MRIVLSTAIVMALGCGSTLAVSGVLGSGADASACFERVYDSTHLARNPNQTVTRIRISVSREAIPGSVGVPPVDFLRVELTQRSEPQVRRIIAWCEKPSGAWQSGARCAITKPDFMSAEEDDSNGEVDIRSAEGGLLARLSPAVRLRTGEKVSIDKGRMVRLGAADRTFRLTKVPAEACADLRRAIREE